MTDQPMFTFEQVESIKAMTRVETILSTVRDDLKIHEEKDEKYFDEIFSAIREIPKTVTTCRDDLKAEIHDYNSQHFVSKQDFAVMKTQIRFSIMGGMTVASVIATVVGIVFKITGV